MSKISARKRIGAFDLGSVNTAFSLIKVSKKPVIKHAFMVPPSLRDLKDAAFPKQMRKLKRTLAKLLDKYKPDEVIAERYMNRGIKGVQVEILGILLGCLSTLCLQRKIPMRLVTASTWKLAVNRREKGLLDKFYSYFPSNKRHRVDAIMIGMWHIDKKFGMNVKRIEKYISKMEGSYGKPRIKKSKSGKA